jgi:sugar phosphate isomerase/epimerase
MNHPLTFSTLACPEWDIHRIISKAAHFGYDGIEWRGGPLGHVQPGMSQEMKKVIRRRLEDLGLFSLAITAYTSFVSPDRQEREDNLEALKNYLNLAAEIGAGYVRAFLGELSAGTPPASAYPLILDCLQPALEFASALGVTIAIEPHDDFVHSASVVPLIDHIDHPRLKVIWDFGNAYAAGEEPEEGFRLLCGKIAYLHVKDGRRTADEWQLCPLGQGEVPLSDVFNLLVNAGYNGAVSVEWERAWHPELDPPEVALPACLQAVRNLWSRN